MDQKELLSITSQNVESQDNCKLISNEKLIRREQIRETPFTAIKEEDKPWIIVMGDSLLKITEYEDFKDVLKYVNKKPWELILPATAVFIEHANKIKNN